MRRKVIRARLVQRIGDASDGNSFVEATADVWREIAAELIPVIGVRGVDVLFSRALYLTSVRFPWLATTGDQEDGDELADLKARLAAAEAVVAAEASFALLATFIELLSALIGEALTDRLLTPVWEPQPPASTPENEA